MITTLHSYVISFPIQSLLFSYLTGTKCRTIHPPRNGVLEEIPGTSVRLICDSGFLLNPTPPGSPGLLERPLYECQGNKWISRDDQVSELTKHVDCTGKNNFRMLSLFMKKQIITSILHYDRKRLYRQWLTWTMQTNEYDQRKVKQKAFILLLGRY